MFTITDAIGIKLITPTNLLTGIGNKLIHYFIDEHGKTQSTQITLNFKNKITGIHAEVINEDLARHLAVVYGGRELAIFELIKNEINIKQKVKFNDFISNIRLYPCTNDEPNEICVLSSHSVAYRIRAHLTDKSDWKTISQCACEDKSTLYSSYILGKPWSKTVCFGGTAFGDLFIWIVQDDCKSCEIVQRVTCHNGVIFSIDCSLSHNLLVTSSDDRSVKVWNLDFTKKASDNWQSCSISSTKSLFGHTARIFRQMIIEYNNQPYIISIGEDSNVCIWTKEGKLLRRQTVCDGAVLWNLDYSPVRKCLLISTSDGNIVQMFLNRILSNAEFKVTKLLDADEYSLDQFDGTSGNFTKIRVMQNYGLIIGLTCHNKLYYQHIDHDARDRKWCIIDQHNTTTQKISLLETCGNLVATASFQTVTILQWNAKKYLFEKFYCDNLSKNFIRSLKFVGSNEFIVCDDAGNCRFISVTEDLVLNSSAVEFTLPVCKERWITAALKTKQNLLVSDRCGNLHLYDIEEEPASIEYRHTLKNVHGYMGCNTISLEEHLSFENKAFASTSGHDGTIKMIKIDNDNHTLKIALTQKIPILWSDKIIRLPNDATDRFVAGFNAKHFVFWHKNTYFLYEYECGGGHRFWDLYIDFNEHVCHFYYLRHKKIYKVKFFIPNHELQPPPFHIDKLNWHTKPCNTVQCILTSGNDLLFISGGDDNLVKFNMLVNGKCDLSSAMQFPMHLNDMTSHISNVTTIFAIKQNDVKNESFLIFSAGGRAQICVTQIQISKLYASLIIEEQCNFMLRGDLMTRRRLDKEQNVIFDPETKFTSMIAYGTYLMVGCSDGYLRQFTYSDNKITFIGATFYGRCILHVDHFEWRSHAYLLTMATDGKICFWSLKNFSEKSLPVFELKHHDSGINSYDLMISYENDKMFIATGGDDQAIVISELMLDKVDESSLISKVNTRRFAYEHTAQVNGVKFAPLSFYLYTYSVDQVILRIDLTTFAVQKVAESCISDAKGLQLINQDKILVYGCGAEIVTLT